jgi:hypothetical protein
LSGQPGQRGAVEAADSQVPPRILDVLGLSREFVHDLVCPAAVSALHFDAAQGDARGLRPTERRRRLVLDRGSVKILPALSGGA